MLKVMYNDQLVYKIVIWAFIWISVWTEKKTFNLMMLDQVCLLNYMDKLNGIYKFDAGFDGHHLVRNHSTSM